MRTHYNNFTVPLILYGLFIPFRSGR